MHEPRWAIKAGGETEDIRFFRAEIAKAVRAANSGKMYIYFNVSNMLRYATVLIINAAHRSIKENDPLYLLFFNVLFAAVNVP